MPWELVVEGEASTSGTVVVPDFDEATVKIDPAHAVRLRQIGRDAAVDGLERIERQDVLDVHEQQFLMLLLVIEAQLDQGPELAEHAVVKPVDQVAEAGIDVVPVEAHVMCTWAADDAAQGPVVSRPYGLVVAVEQEPVLVLEGAEVGLVVGQKEGLEEPGHMCPVPFGGRHVGHRLDGLVFRRKRRREPLGVGAHFGIAVEEGDWVGTHVNQDLPLIGQAYVLLLTDCIRQCREVNDRKSEFGAC